MPEIESGILGLIADSVQSHSGPTGFPSPCYPMLLQMHSQGVPPHWGAYVAVDDAEASAAKAESLGGRLIQKPFDVMTG